MDRRFLKVIGHFVALENNFYCEGVAMFDPGREGALVFPRPPPGHPLRTPSLVDVVLDPYLTAKIRSGTHRFGFRGKNNS